MGMAEMIMQDTKIKRGFAGKHRLNNNGGPELSEDILINLPLN
jgi:hypothetical protein